MTLSDGMWSGQSCLIVGGGPSLRALQAADWWRLEDRFPARIAVNRAAEFFKPSLWVGVDSVYWRKKVSDNLHRIARSVGLPRVWVDHGEKHPGEDKVDLVLPCAAPPGTPNRHWAHAWGRSLAEGVGAGGNSGFAALNLADVLGAETVYLLGFDMRGGEDGRVTHFHDGYPGEKPASSDVFARWIKGFEWASSQVRAKVVVLEVSKGDSALECFEKRLAEEVL